MQIINIRQAKTQLSKLVEQAAKGRVLYACQSEQAFGPGDGPGYAPTGDEVRRRGFMAGQMVIPDGFDRLGDPEIAQLFGDA